MLNLKIAAAVGRQHPFAEKIVIFWFAIGGEAHHLPLVAGEHIKADVVRHGRIKLAQRMRQLDAF